MAKAVRVDEDGNWLAEYELGAGERLEVRARGVAKLSLEPERAPLSSERAMALVAASSLWPVQSGVIRELAGKLESPRAMYEYVVDLLEYDYQKVIGSSRVSAEQVLESPQSAICTDFADLLVSLLRAGGVPARELQGYALARNDRLRPLSLSQDVLHAWVEYYDRRQERWIQVDPTWGKTTGGVDYFEKLDLNHFVFVIHGSDPIYPLPAGAYKGVEGGKDVEVVAVAPVEWVEPRLEFGVREVNEGWGKRWEIEVRNVGQVGVRPILRWYSQPVDIIKGERGLPLIPPGGSEVVKTEVLGWWKMRQKIENLIVEYEGQREVIEWEGGPSYPLGLAAGAGGAVVAGVALWLRRLWVRR